MLTRHNSKIVDTKHSLSDTCGVKNLTSAQIALQDISNVILKNFEKPFRTPQFVPLEETKLVY